MVTDFGLAKQVESQGGQTSTGAVVGTPAYMAPEQARGERDLTTAVDVYSLGAILYELLTGRPPFHGATPVETLLMVISDEPKRPSSVLPRVKRDLETIALKCLAKEPSQRYRSADELADELTRYLAGEPILAQPVGHIERAWRWCRRNPVVAALSSAAGLLVLTVAIVSTAAYFREAHLKSVADLKTEEARQSEAKAENKATEQARRAEGKAVEEASLARKAEHDATQSEQESQQSLYYASIGLAYRYLQEGDVGPAGQILDRCPRQLRQWEWWFLKDLTVRGRRNFARRSMGGP